MSRTKRSSQKPRKPSKAQLAVLQNMQAHRRARALAGDKENHIHASACEAEGSLKPGKTTEPTSPVNWQLEDLHLHLQALNIQCSSLSADLDNEKRQNRLLDGRLEHVQQENACLQDHLTLYKTRLCNEHRRLIRAQKTASSLHAHLKSANQSHPLELLKSERRRLDAEHSEERTRIEAEMVLHRLQEVNDGLRSELSGCRREAQKYKKRVKRLPKMLAEQTRKLRSRPLTLHLKEKGVYTAKARKLARMLIRAGCAQRKVGTLIQVFRQAMGVLVKGTISAHTVRRIAYEGGHASNIQLAYEIGRATSFTISGDATTNRSVNYEARHMLLNFAGADDLAGVCNRLLGVDSSLDHTSKSQAQGWIEKLQELVKMFNESPLALRRMEQLELDGCALKLTGMGGDHAADQIKTHGLIACWKKEMTYHFLARNHLGSGEQAPGALQKLIEDASRAAVQSTGGPEAWAALSSDNQTATYVEQLNAATTCLGEALYEDLPVAEKRSLDLFMRLGCAMHKDLNSVKGGNTTMTSAWGELRATPPVLLANKENVSTLRDVNLDTIAAAASLLSTEDLTAAELQALESSTRGGVKLASLAGALFNHKDDKKGHHDTYLYYFEDIVGQPLRFPDTSNTRYGSHCAATAELLVNRHHYLRFLEVIRDRKEHPGFNNMEENVHRGLQDMPTLTELAVLALYGQAISHPYLRTTRAPQNGLKLGAFHAQLKAHIQTLIDDPDLLLGPSASCQTAAFDAKEWERPEVVSAVLELAPELPHLEDILVAFLKGALRTWEHFTAEFAEGSAIDLASDAELDRAYLLPTNDHNEGVLGSYCIWSRWFPNGSQAYYNALAKFFRNDTADFMETHLDTDEDQRHLRKAARELDSSGHEAARRRAHAAHSIAVVLQHAESEREKREKLDAEMVKLSAVELVLNFESLTRLTNGALDEQLEVYRKREEDPSVPMKTKVKRKAEKLEALEGAVARYRVRCGELAWVAEAREAAYIWQPPFPYTAASTARGHTT